MKIFLRSQYMNRFQLYHLLWKNFENYKDLNQQAVQNSCVNTLPKTVSSCEISCGILFSSNIISYFIASEIFNIYLKHIQRYKSHYQFKANLDKALCVDAIQKILDSNKVRVPKVFVNFWSICMILGISVESIHIIFVTTHKLK